MTVKRISANTYLLTVVKLTIHKFPKCCCIPTASTTTQLNSIVCVTAVVLLAIQSKHFHSTHTSIGSDGTSSTTTTNRSNSCADFLIPNSLCTTLPFSEYIHANSSSTQSLFLPPCSQRTSTVVCVCVCSLSMCMCVCV